jgi:GxxExxY protein
MDIFDFHARNESRLDPALEDLAFAVIGAAIEVHRELGPGLSELHYLKAMCHELKLRGIPYAYEVPIHITYKGEPIGDGRLDLLVAGQLIVELKAVEHLTDVHRSQAITYLHVTKHRLALLINFNVAILKDGIKRVINST